MKKRNWKSAVVALLLVLCMVMTMSEPVMATSTDALGDLGQETSTSPVWLEEVEEEEPGNGEVAPLAEEAEEPVPEYDDSDVVRVFIVLEDEPVIDTGVDTTDLPSDEDAMELMSDLKGEQAAMAKKISKEALDGAALDIRYHFTILSNALSANVAYGDIEKIKEVKGVSDVLVVPQYEIMDTGETAEPQMATAGPMVGSTSVWANGYTGAGQRIAVIDTGIDSDHPSFDGGAFDYSLGLTAAAAGTTVDSYQLLNKDEIAAVLPNLKVSERNSGVTADKLFLSDKIAFAFNYVDRNLDVTHDNDAEGDHGTHVSGISCADLYVPDGNGGYVKQENGVAGIAPDAQLITMKVFGSNGGAYTDDYMAAIEDALLLRCDAVNLSLGSSSAGNSADAEAYINDIFNKLQGTDTVVSISAGNSGAWADDSVYGGNLPSDVNMDTVGSPGSYTNAFTVASAVNSGYTGYGATFNGKSNVIYTDGSGAPSFSTLDTTGNGTEYDYVLLDAVGAEKDYDDVDVAGKIVLVKRGSISFADKHSFASAKNAAGILVYNNQPGTISMSLSGTTGTIPCASITQADAEIIKAGATADGSVYTGKITVYKQVKTFTDVPDGYSMSDFSSWGVPGSLEMKPEITAPGGNIYSTLDGGNYGQMSGTSMAAPSVAGMSALVAQYIKANKLNEKTGLSIRTLSQSLLMSTATPLVESDGEEYSVRNQGAGLANAAYATTSPSYILVGNKEGNDGKVKIELGDDPQKTGNYSFSFDVYSMDGKTHVYTPDSSVLTEALSEDGLITGSSYKLSPQVSITSSSTCNFYDLNLDGRVDAEDAKTLLSHVNGSSILTAAEEYEDKFDFNKDGKIDTADVHDFLVAIKSGSDVIANAPTVIAVKDSTTVNVSITLSDADKNYLASFENGMYVDGYIYLKGAVNLSVPVLAFYGNWADSSMYEPFDLLEYANSGDNWEYPYTATVGSNGPEFDYTNYLTYQYAGNTKKYYYTSNMYAEKKDDSYLADRNAISSEHGDTVSTINYSLIRNAARVIVGVRNAKTGESYYRQDLGSKYAEFYNASSADWKNTIYSAALNWKGTDAAGRALSDGTKVEIYVTAIPAYYDGTDADKVSGKGVTFSVPMTVDNQEPQAEVEPKDVQVADGKITLTVSDNRYVAAVNVYDHDKKTLKSSYNVNQTEAGADSSVTIDDIADVFYIKVYDYAGNYKQYRVNHSGTADTEQISGISLDQSTLTMIKGSQETLTATCEPVSLLDDSVTWESSRPEIVSVDENGILTAVAAGSAMITATSVAKNAGGKSMTATCEVTVEELNVDLDAVLWDEEGSVYWTTFNTTTLPDYKKLSDAQSSRFMSATYLGDGKVLAASGGDDSDSQKSDLYIVDTKNGYSQKLLLEGHPWCTDLTYSATSGLAYATYESYVALIDPAAGESLGFVDMKQDYWAGLAYAETASDGTDYLYGVTRSGGLYKISVNLSANQIGIAKVADLGVSSIWYYNSLCYDKTTGYLFWNRFSGGSNVTLYAIKDTSTNSANQAAIYEIGNFPDDVWPVAGLYQTTDSNTTSGSSDLTTLFEGIEMQPMNTETEINGVEPAEEIGR